MPTSTFGKQTEMRQNNFDFLRFVLIFSHSFELLNQNRQEPLVRFTYSQEDLGQLAVNSFFIISGFLIANSWLHSRSLVRFAKNRALRIYPGFIAALFFCAIVVVPLSGAPLSAYVHQRDVFQFVYRPLLFRDVVCIRGAFTDTPLSGFVNGSLWTIRFEIACYAFVVLCGLLGVYKKRTVVLAGFVGMLVVHNCWHGTINLPYFDKLEALPRLLTYFLAGMTFYTYKDVIPRSRILFAVCLVLLVLTSRLGSLSWALPICGTYVLFYAAFSSSLKANDFARKGDLSYGAYLYGFPIQQLLVHFAGHWLTPISLFSSLCI